MSKKRKLKGNNEGNISKKKRKDVLNQNINVSISVPVYKYIPNEKIYIFSQPTAQPIVSTTETAAAAAAVA